MTWNGKIGLMTVSEFLRSNINAEQCGNYKLNNVNYSNCKTTNYIVPIDGYLWTVSPLSNTSISMAIVRSDGFVYNRSANLSSYGVLPALYLTSEITLEGEGTSDNPYTIVSK